MIYYAKTHKGKIRKVNEDAVYIPDKADGCFAIVADGMGGHNAGEIASGLVIKTICDLLSRISNICEETLVTAFRHANSQVWHEARKDKSKQGMGSTATAAVFAGGRTIIGNVGDSRAYLFRDACLSQITKDHSYVQMLIDKGLLEAQDALRHPHKNVITRAIGTDAKIDVDVFSVDIKDGDVFLLCSDGLNNMVPDEEIQKILSHDLKTAADRLVDAALAAGGIDNVSVVLAVADGGHQ